MLVLRQSQIEVFSILEAQKFEDWMVSHLQRFFPLRCATLGNGKLRETIRRCTARAANHGIRTKRDVCKFVDLVIVLGEDFDSGEPANWASKILSKPVNSGVKMRMLISGAKSHLATKQP